MLNKQQIRQLNKQKIYVETLPNDDTEFRHGHGVMTMSARLLHSRLSWMPFDRFITWLKSELNGTVYHF
jgi:hypothetical protein